MNGTAGSIGQWEQDSAGLPCFRLTASLPLVTATPGGTSVGYPTDPWFLLGNYRLTLFVHASGKYQLMSAEHGFARLNYADATPPCASRTLFRSDPTDPTGQPCGAPVFGVGFAAFCYQRDALSIRRTLATLPSDDYQDGCSAFLVRVDVENQSDTEREFAYTEELTARYDFCNWHNRSCRPPRADYPANPATYSHTCIGAEFDAQEQTPFVFAAPGEAALADGNPPTVMLEALTGDHVAPRVEAEQADTHSVRLSATCEGRLAPRAHTRFGFIIGYQFNGEWGSYTARLKSGLDGPSGVPPFRDEWRARIPVFESERTAATRTEMQWHAATLHAMACWTERWQETFIPQGTVYEYNLGVAACIRDHVQHMLPVCRHDADLARSVLRFAFKRTDEEGSIRTADEGAGRVPLGADQKSDNQLYLFLAVAEYLRVTGDYAFLGFGLGSGTDFRFKSEPNHRPPHTLSLKSVPDPTVLDRLVRCFCYLRDVVATGPNGLVRMLCSDWNDCFYRYCQGLPYAMIFNQAESHLNTAMAIAVLGELAAQLQHAVGDTAATLARAMIEYRAELLDAFMRDWGDRAFPARAYVGDHARFGVDTMFLEPQPWALMIPEVSREKKLKLWHEVRARLLEGEKRGARQAEVPVGEFKDGGRGSRENGGFWFALNGPLVRALAQLDSDAARDLHRRMTLKQHAQDFPGYWPGMWSGPDSFDSSLLPTEGCGSRYVQSFPVYCAHAHAWPLDGWYVLAEM